MCVCVCAGACTQDLLRYRCGAIVNLQKVQYVDTVCVSKTLEHAHAKTHMQVIVRPSSKLSDSIFNVSDVPQSFKMFQVRA